MAAGIRKSRPTQALNVGFQALLGLMIPKVLKVTHFQEKLSQPKRQKGSRISFFFHKKKKKWVNSDSFTLPKDRDSKKKCPAFYNCVLHLHITTPGGKKQILDFKK